MHGTCSRDKRLSSSAERGRRRRATYWPHRRENDAAPSTGACHLVPPMGPTIELRSDSPTAQLAGVVPRWILLPSSLVGRQRRIMISPERLAHLRRRHPQWLTFCLARIGQVSRPDRRGMGEQRLPDRRPLLDSARAHRYPVEGGTRTVRTER